MAYIRRNTLSTSTKGRPTYSYTVVWTETLRDKFGRPIPINPARPEGRHKTKDHQDTYRTREGAQERVDELNAARNRPTGTSASEVRRLGDRTLGEYAEDWLDSMEVRVAAGKLKADTLAEYRRLLSTYVLSAPAPRGTGGIGDESRSGARSETSRASSRRSTLGATPVAQVTPRMCEALLRDLVGRELSPKTVKHAWAQLNRVLKYAMRHDAIPSNPADRVEFDGSGVGDRAAFEHHPLTAAQVASVAAVVGERYPVYELMTLFLAYTGLRSAELSGLEVRDLELAARPTHAGTPTYTGTVHVRRTKARKGGEWRTSTPKSKRSRRSVSLPPWLAERLAGFLAEHPYGPTLPDGSPNPDHRPEASLWPSRIVGGNRIPGQLAVVPLTYEVPVSGGTFYETVLQPALAEVGLPVSRPARPVVPADLATGTPAQPARPATRGVRLHDLRHTFATMQLMAGVHYLQVSRWLGHATFTLTLDTYGDWIPEAEGGVGNALPDPTAVATPVVPATAPQEETLAQIVPLFGRRSG